MRELLEEVRRRGIRLKVENGQLAYTAPAGALDNELVLQLRDNKQALIRLLAPSAREPIPRLSDPLNQRLSFAQQRMWFHWLFDPASTAYCVPVAMRIEGPLDPAALVATCEILRERHEILRSRIDDSSGEALQRLVADPLDFGFFDVEQVGGDGAALRAIHEAMAFPVDLRQRLPFEVRLWRTSSSTHYLLLRLHHIGYDGWSNQLLMRELWQAYEALLSGNRADFAPLPIQYADFAAWQRQRFADGYGAADLKFWEEQLHGCALRLDLSPLPPGERSAAAPAAEERFAVDAQVSSALARIAQAQGATLFMTLLAAWRVLLARCLDQDDFVVGTPAIHRAHPDCEAVVGFFGNTLLMRNALRPDDSFNSVLKRERECALAAYAHQETPLDLVVEHLVRRGVEEPGAATEVMFLFGERAPAVYPVGALSVEFLELPPSGSKFGIGLWVKELATGGLSGHIEYSPRDLAGDTIARLAAEFAHLLAAIVEDPNARLNALATLDPAAATAKIGRAQVGDFRAYVLNSKGVPLPVGVTGQLCLSGSIHPSGHSPSTAVEPDHVGVIESSLVPDQPLFRTGDLARMRPDDSIEIVGRDSAQIRLRGRTIDSDTVCAAILELAGVADVAVGVSNAAKGAADLAAWMVVRDGGVDGEAVRQSLVTTLPDHMIPRQIVPVEEIPRDSQGKINFAALIGAAPTRVGPASALTRTGARLAAIWSEVLQVEVTADTDFFEAGGTSLTAMSVVAQINAALATQLSLRALFELRRLAMVADYVDALAPATEAPWPHAHLGEDVPTTLLQRNLWKVHHRSAAPAHLNLWRSFTLPPEVGQDALDQAVTALAERYPVLSARFPSQRRGGIQRFDSAPPVVERFTADSAVQDRPTDPDRVRAIYQMGRPFDLGEGPCWRLGAYRQADGAVLVMLVVHHILGDKWTVDRLAEELRAVALQIELPGTSNKLAAAISFADYAVWERESLAADRFADQIQWWLQVLGPPWGELTLPDYAEAGLADAQSRTFEIPMQLWTAIERGARKAGATMFTALLGAFMIVLARRTGEADQRVCTNHVRRHRQQTAAILGPLNDLLVVRSRIPVTVSAPEAVIAVERQMRECRDALDVPFSQVLARLLEQHEATLAQIAPYFFMLHQRDVETAGQTNDAALQPDYIANADNSYALLLNIETNGSRAAAKLHLKAGVADRFSGLEVDFLATLSELAMEWDD